MSEFTISLLLLPLIVSVLVFAWVAKRAANHDLSLSFKGLGISLDIKKASPQPQPVEPSGSAATSEQ